MIVVRLFLHDRRIRAVTGSPAGFSGLYKAIATMLVESCALLAVNSLLVIGLLFTDNPAANTFFAILAQTQVRASPANASFRRVNLFHDGLSRSSLHCSSYDVSPTGVPLRVTQPPPELSVHSKLGTERGSLAAALPFLVRTPIVLWVSVG